MFIYLFLNITLFSLTEKITFKIKFVKSIFYFKNIPPKTIQMFYKLSAQYFETQTLYASTILYFTVLRTLKMSLI